MSADSSKKVEPSISADSACRVRSERFRQHFPKSKNTGLGSIRTPQLLHLHSGKVRESFRVDNRHRLLIVTDRISCFDRILDSPIPGKGAVLNGISAFWFQKTRDICPSHFVRVVDPNAALVREARPIRVEMVVRGYLTGSAWRAYEKGKREFSGVPLPDGLTRNQKFLRPILTPTTKEKSDREIAPGEIVSSGLATEAQWMRMSELSLSLFERGTAELVPRNLLLIDTKYEFGIIDGEVALIDEIHTTDSSRFWFADSYADDPDSVKSLDKEFVRQWLLDHKLPDGTLPTDIPADVSNEARCRFFDLFRQITGAELPVQIDDPRERLAANLVREGLIRDSFVAVVMGSAGDKEFGKRIKMALEPFNVFVAMRVVSAHKNGERLVELAEEYNKAIEPGVVIAVAGRSNGLGGALAANLNIPVINCPPFKNLADYSVNIHSSLQMPSETPALTILSPEGAALAAIRCLNRHRLRDLASVRVADVKARLIEDDRAFGE